MYIKVYGKYLDNDNKNWGFCKLEIGCRIIYVIFLIYGIIDNNDKIYMITFISFLCIWGV